MKIDTFLLHKILEICNILQGQRSTVAVYHVLVGKQNHQTWSDVHFFQLQSYYRFITDKEEQLFKMLVSYAQNRNWIIEQDQLVYVTKKGEEILTQYSYQSVAHRDGRIIITMERYWAFLHLLVQTVSHLLHQRKPFYPIIRDLLIQKEVKTWIAKFGLHNGVHQLFHDLQTILEQFPESIAMTMVQRLSGADRIALTLEQLARQTNKTVWEMKWEWEATLSKLYEIIEQGKYPSLPKLPHKSEYLMSNSAKKTYQLLRSNKSLEEISTRRNLKITTIMDHVVEIALLDQGFDITPYISLDDVQAIQDKYQQTKSFLLKSYKTIFPHLTYFQIRLALTRVKRN